jgi:hypothetical protein
MLSAPLAIAEWLFKLPWMRRPAYLVAIADGRPSASGLPGDVLVLEVRNGHLKWAHLICPKCGDQIELPMAGRGHWSARVDWLRRPTLSPSIWEKASCGAHFFIRKGDIRWSR